MRLKPGGWNLARYSVTRKVGFLVKKNALTIRRMKRKSENADLQTFREQAPTVKTENTKNLREGKRLTCATLWDRKRGENREHISGDLGDCRQRPRSKDAVFRKGQLSVVENSELKL